MDKAAEADSWSAERLAGFPDQMQADSDPCIKQSGLLIRAVGLRIRFTPLPRSGGFDTEASYDPPYLNVNSELAYLRHPDNLKKKAAHESFHWIQTNQGWITSDGDIHNYGHRDRIAAYMAKRFPGSGDCRLPEVPAELRGAVPDRVITGGLLDNRIRLEGIPSVRQADSWGRSDMAPNAGDSSSDRGGVRGRRRSGAR